MYVIILEAIFLGFGLAMDAAALSAANGLAEPQMSKHKMILIAGSFGLFQGIMPLIGYLTGSLFEQKLEHIMPWLALLILSFIGIKMIFDSFQKSENTISGQLTIKMLVFQAVITSIDALAVGVIFVAYPFWEVLVSVITISFVTFISTICAVYVGMKIGNRFTNKAKLCGGIVLIIIGVKIFVDYLLIML